jgi:hypothetical protein
MTFLMFPLGMRLSTWVVLLLFTVIPTDSRKKALLAAGGFLGSFEVFFQVCSVIDGRWSTPRSGTPTVAGYGAVLALAAWRAGVRPSRAWFAADAVAWAAWFACGFHPNQHTLVGLNVRDEVLNEAAKTLWGLAYLMPLTGWKLSDVRRVPTWRLAKPVLQADRQA